MAIGAIITADIVNSTLLTDKQEKKLFSTLTALLSPYLFEFYRGDSFQAYIKEPKEAYKAALLVRAAAKKLTPEASMPVFDVRISIGIGAVPTPLKVLKTASGEAFTLSGRAFDTMRDSEARLVMQSAIPPVNAALKVIAYFTDYIFQQLTTKQAAVVAELLLGHTQTDIAKKLKKSAPTINKHAQSSGWPEISALLEEYEYITTQL